MKRDIKAIIFMLSTQAMINLGIIPDPVSKNSLIQLDKAEVFIELLAVLKLKTKGNLNLDEQKHLDEVYENVVSAYKKKRKIKV